MAKVRLSLALGNHDLTQALSHGEIEVEGVELFLSAVDDTNERHERLRNREFDAGEFSMSFHAVATAKGGHPFTGIPVFPHRRFPHSNFVANLGSGINSPADVRGKKVGVNSLQSTWSIWSAGILEEHHGVPYKDIQWCVQGGNFVERPTTQGLSVSPLPKGKNLNAALLDGDIDMIATPGIPSVIRSGSPKVKRLFPDFKSEEILYYRKTGVFPIMHVVVIKEELVRQYPWIARNLVEAFDQAKKAWLDFIESSWALSLVWYRALLEEEKKVFTKDVWANNLKDNESAIATLIRYLRQQGMIDRELPVSSLFAEPFRS